MKSEKACDLFALQKKQDKLHLVDLDQEKEDHQTIERKYETFDVFTVKDKDDEQQRSTKIHKIDNTYEAIYV